MAKKTKLDDVIDSLSPADAVLNLVQLALQEEHWLSYTREMIRAYGLNPTEMRATLNRVKEQVEHAREKATKGMPKAESERLLRAAWPETRFLLDLQWLVNEEEIARWRQWGLVSLATTGLVETDPSEFVGHVVEIADYLQQAAQFVLGPIVREVLPRKRVLELLSDRYFDGRPFVFQGALTQLDWEVKSIERFIDLFNNLYSELYATTYFAGIDVEQEAIRSAQAIVDQVRAQIFIGARNADRAFEMMRRGDPEGLMEVFWPSE